MSVAHRSNHAYDYRAAEREREKGATHTQAQPRVAQRTQPVALQRVLLFAAAVLVAAACIGLLFLKAQVAATQRSINETQKNLTKLERANSELSAQMAAAENINLIMDRAQELGMGTPKQSQVLYVSLGSLGRTDISAKK